MKKHFLFAITTFAILFGLLLTPALLPAQEANEIPDANVPRIPIDELKAKLDRGENVIIIDVRSPGGYDRSPVKIKGAIRIAPIDLETRAKELPFGMEIVTYCS